MLPFLLGQVVLVYQFKAIVTFVVALLNSSTVFITARYFEELAVASSRDAA